MGTLMKATGGPKLIELAMAKQKIKREENSKNDENHSAILHQQTLLLEKGVEQLNNHTEMFLKQQNEGVNKFFELEAMKYASKSDRKEYFQAVSKRTILIERNCLLETEIKHEQLLKKMNKTKENHAAQEEHKNENGSNVSR